MENQSRMMYGSINVTELINQFKKSHNGFTKADNGNIYANVKVWLNQEQDQYNNDASIQITAKAETDCKNFYIGNLKYSVFKEKVNEINVDDILNLDIENDNEFPY